MKNTTKSIRLAVLAGSLSLVTMQTSSAASLLTTSFATAPVATTTSGDRAISLGTGGKYLVETAGISTVDIDQWTFNSSTTPGTNRMSYASGSYSSNTNSGSNLRGTIQIMNDGSLTTGLVNVSLTTTIAAGDTVTVELYGWNTGQTSPGLSWGGPNASAVWNDTVVGGATTLINTSYTTSGTKAVATGLNLGTGYDFYSWRVGMSAASGTGTSFSNLTVVPEPSSLALLGLGGLALTLRRRK